MSSINTAFGKNLLAIRNKAIADGMTLMTENEIIDFDLWQRLKESEDIKNEDWKKMREEKLSSVELLKEGKKLQRIEDERTTP